MAVSSWAAAGLVDTEVYAIHSKGNRAYWTEHREVGLGSVLGSATDLRVTLVKSHHPFVSLLRASVSPAALCVCQGCELFSTRMASETVCVHVLWGLHTGCQPVHDTGRRVC